MNNNMMFTKFYLSNGMEFELINGEYEVKGIKK